MSCNCAINQEFEDTEARKKISQDLRKSATIDAWQQLYKCQHCGTYWENYYAYPEAQGGGPLSIRKVDIDYAKEHYGIGKETTKE